MLHSYSKEELASLLQDARAASNGDEDVSRVLGCALPFLLRNDLHSDYTSHRTVVDEYICDESYMVCLKVLHCDLKDVPLYLNDHFYSSLIARWRLKIGR